MDSRSLSRQSATERRISALEGQIYGVAARTQVNLICVRTLAERGHVGAGRAQRRETPAVQNRAFVTDPGVIPGSLQVRGYATWGFCRIKVTSLLTWP